MPFAYVNIQLELNRWMKRIRLPRTVLRKRYAQLVHAYHVLDGSCNHNALIYAMQTLLDSGWNSADDSDPTCQYSICLRDAIADLRGMITHSLA